jgi:hypothetical protein
MRGMFNNVSRARAEIKQAAELNIAAHGGT